MDLPRGRTLHVIDVENLVGGSAVDLDAVAPALAAYRRSVAVAEIDHVVLGTGPRLAFAAKVAWPGAQLRVGRGVDGADRALLTALESRFVAARYGRVVVASGDHAFCGLVSSLRALGTAVVVVTRDELSLSRPLRRLTMHRTLAAAS